MRRYYRNIGLFLLFIGVALFRAEADELNGTVSWTKKASRGAYLFFEDDHSLPNSPQAFGDFLLVVDQVAKKFVTPMFVGIPGNHLIFQNSDSVEHNIYLSGPALEKDVDLGTAPPGVVLTQKLVWPVGSLVNVSCRIHPEMQASILALDSLYSSLVEFDGKKNKQDVAFKIKDIPENTVKLKILFTDKTDEIRVEIRGGETKTLDIVSTGPDKSKYGTLKLTRTAGS